MSQVLLGSNLDFILHGLNSPISKMGTKLAYLSGMTF